MKAFFSILALVLTLTAPAFADESVSGGGSADASNGANGASNSSGQASANWGNQGANNGDPQQAPPAPPSVAASEPLLPAFCPSGLCYKNSFNGDNSSCGAGAKGSSPGQSACNNWSGNIPGTSAPTDNGKTTQ